MGACKYLNLGVMAKWRGRTYRPERICKIGVKKRTASPISSPPPILLNHLLVWLSNILVKVLEVLAHSHHELVGVGAINDAVIVAHGKPDDVPHGN